jgi:hypothetical protein
MATTDDSRNSERGEDDEITSALRESIRRSFPAGRYTGKVTPHDGEYDPNDEATAILDDDQFLCDALNGQRWTEIPTDFLHTQPDGYALLTDDAFVAFLPAWLMSSLEGMNAENEIRDFVVYSFCDSSRQFRVLNSAQRLTVRSILEEFTRRGTSEFVKKLAVKAVSLIDAPAY